MLILTILLMSFLVKLSSSNRIKYDQAMLDIYRLLMGQTSNSFHLLINLRKDRWKRPIKFIVLQVLLYISFVVNTILTKSMSSLLMETYINPERLPMFNNLQDIANDLGLSGLSLSLGLGLSGRDLLLEFNETSTMLWEKLKLKMKGNTIDSKRLTRKINVTTINRILDGKLIILDNSKNNQETILMFPDVPLALGGDMYKSTLFTFFINKNAAKAKEIKQL